MKNLLWVLGLCFFFWGCSPKQGAHASWMQPSSKLHVLSTIAQIGDLVEEVGGERVACLTLIRGSLDPHSYELVKGDGEKFERADLIFYNGLGLEHGASLFSFLQESEKGIAVGEAIAQKNPSSILYKSESVDPHLWMDVSLWKEGVDSIVVSLSRLDPEGESYYFERGERLKKRLTLLHEEILGEIKKVPSEKRYLITSHDAFRYFVKSYFSSLGDSSWEERFAAPEGLAPDGQINPSDLKRIVLLIEEKRIEVLFPESNVSLDSIRKITSAGKEMGINVQLCKEPLYGDSSGGHTYFEMMRQNGKVIARSLAGDEQSP